jgi:hypothetical protein
MMKASSEDHCRHSSATLVKLRLALLAPSVTRAMNMARFPLLNVGFTAHGKSESGTDLQRANLSDFGNSELFFGINIARSLRSLQLLGLGYTASQAKPPFSKSVGFSPLSLLILAVFMPFAVASLQVCPIQKWMLFVG